MQLDERKIKILEVIVNDYILSAEPIGSRTIAKKYDFGIGSATIRNEMSDLEELGLILQPHASSGRIPSDKGYRLYVDRMMKKKELSSEESLYLHELVMNKITRIDELMRETAKAIAYLTNYTTIVSEPQVKKQTLRHVQLVPLDETNIIVVVVNDAKVVKNQTVRVACSPSPEALNKLSALLNQHLQNVSPAFLSGKTLEVLTKAFGNYGDLLPPIFSAIVNVLNQSEEVQWHTSGFKNLLAFPEFSDLEKARTIFTMLEEKDVLINLLGNQLQGNIQIIIGSENQDSIMQDCSIIKANYGLDESTFGSIGIIGPTRMAYGQVVSVLNVIVDKINMVIANYRDG